MDVKTYDLVVKAIKPETSDSCSIVFDVPASVKEAFEYKSGQFISLGFKINGKKEVRSYSISSAPFEEDLQVSVKRVKKGLVSNHILDQIKAGDSVEVSPVDGQFTLEPREHLKETYYFVAAGSGITPIFSMIKTCLEYQPMSTLVLLYGNKDKDSVIFSKELELLEKRYAGQLFVYHTHSKAGGLFGKFKKSSAWSDSNRLAKGRLDADKITTVMQLHPKTLESKLYLCGPEGLIDSSMAAFSQGGLSKKNMFKELFVVSQDSSVGVNCTMTVLQDGEEEIIEVKKGQNLLDALIDSGIDAAYSCRAGACSSCVAKITDGEVFMKEHAALDRDEVKDGYILCCQAQATTEEITIDMNA